MSRALRIASLLAFTAPFLGAQETLLPSTGWGTGASLSGWHFSTPIAQTGGALADIAEVSIPFRIRTGFGQWTVDLSGAGAFGAAHFTAGSSQQGQGGGNGGDSGGDRLVTIAGPTDLKLRATGPLVSDNLRLTIGLNIPTGKVGLNADETSVLQVIGSPALQMPIGAFGTGAGATVGLIRAFEGDDWALAVGGSIEQRTEYSPIALLLSTGKAETRVTPGTAAHVTLGLDRSLGEGRFSVLAVGDIFSKDKVAFDDGSGGVTNDDFQLGPQMTVTTRYDFGAASWRESSLNLAARVRSEYSDSSGAKVSGSSGTYLEGSLGGVRGGADGAGFIVGVDGRWHSGLKFTDALVGAAVTAVGVSLGVENAHTNSARRFVVHAQYGTFDTGKAKSSGFGVTLGFSVGARREVQ